MGFRLLTGATGLLGSYLLRDLIARNLPVAVLARPTRCEDAETRIDGVLAQMEESFGRTLVRPVVLCGDITRPQLGLAHGDLNWLRANCDAVLHAAASLTFHEADGEPWLTNVEGVRNVLAVCRDCHIGRLDHVSTAYVCGLRTGRVLETELDIGQEFGNDYERSKVNAEKLIRSDEHLPAFTIFRPSIIVGDSHTGFTSTFHGFYVPLRVAGALLPLVGVDQALEVDYLRLLGLNGHERKNFVPVDWVSDAIVSTLLRSAPANQTYALVSEHPVQVARLHRVFLEIVRQHRQLIEEDLAARKQGSHADFQEAKRGRFVEAFRHKFVEQFAVYQSYWRDDPIFDKSATNAMLPDLPCPRMTDAMLHRLCQYAADKNYGMPPFRAPKLPFSPRAWIRASGMDAAAAQASASHPSLSLALAISGPGGGSWTLCVNGTGTFSYVPGCEAADSVARMTSACFQDLVCGRKSLAESLDAGRLVLYGDQRGLNQLQSLVQMAATRATDSACGRDAADPPTGTDADLATRTDSC
jgi:thioester reductase-like protein